DQQSPDIVIVGLGPVGSMAALLFAEAGMTVSAIERERDVYPLPRAVNLDGEVIRAFQQIGRGEVVNALMQAARPGDRAGFANAKREWLFGQKYSSLGVNGWQSSNMFDQPEFEKYLRDEILSHPNITCYLGCDVVKIENVTGGVELDFVSADTVATLNPTYLLGCDGASSFVRKSFDIQWRDLGYDHDWLVVDVTLREGATLNNDTVQVCDPDRIVTYVCTKDPFRRWEFKLNPGETKEEMLKTQTIESLIDAWTPPGTYEIRRAAVYQFHAALADTWRVGNCFIAGDAAHQTPPFLGQGLNAGMRDVINLAWKLPMVIQQVASDRLLDTYYLERNAHAHDLVEWAVAIGRLMEHLTDIERAKRDNTPPPREPVALRSAGYGQGREAPPIRDGVVCLEQVSDTGSTGYLFSQPLVSDAQGNQCRLDELLTPGFVVVAKTQDDLSLTDASRNILARINANLVTLAGLREVKGHFDRLFDHCDVAIVRPDRIVFGHTTENTTLDDLVTVLGDRLALSPLTMCSSKIGEST
ncbi:MAG: bifunctional 3-(3-hydroxy-phenyl)propionate/3-hydroxycinnamic acid hydroxylase, partial [Gammaproteobacteria bacterium]|nr:bifunctional 3-(3-hydroxy-phenyl)propionate/3-hydroxycinnamic acid hydroxylase [Gammaproteobacteria bacterium]